MNEIVACSTCGLVQTVPALSGREASICCRCGFTLHKRRPKSCSRTAALALAAFILFFPANIYPIIKTEYWGAHTEMTIWDGVRGLLEEEEYLVGILILTTSIITPALKILSLLFLSLTAGRPGWKAFKTRLYKLILIVDPWNMLEVYLLAIAVAIAELGKVANVDPGAGVISFAGVVVLTILASLTFDPRVIWDGFQGGTHAENRSERATA